MVFLRGEGCEDGAAQLWHSQRERSHPRLARSCWCSTVGPSACRPCRCPKASSGRHACLPAGGTPGRCLTSPPACPHPARSYRLENTLNYGMERVWAVGYAKGHNSIAVG